MSAEWDEPRTELLKRLWAAGETARTIAERLGEGVTRNAVIGKAHRLGLTGVAYSEKRGERLAHRNGYRELDWQTRAGTVELRFVVTVPRVTTSFTTRWR